IVMGGGVGGGKRAGILGPVTAAKNSIRPGYDNVPALTQEAKARPTASPGFLGARKSWPVGRLSSSSCHALDQASHKIASTTQIAGTEPAASRVAGWHLGEVPDVAAWVAAGPHSVGEIFAARFRWSSAAGRECASSAFP